MSMGFLFGHVKRSKFKKRLEIRRYYIDDCLFEIVQGTRHGPDDRIIKLNGVPITFCVLLELIKLKVWNEDIIYPPGTNKGGDMLVEAIGEYICGNISLEQLSKKFKLTPPNRD